MLNLNFSLSLSLGINIEKKKVFVFPINKDRLCVYFTFRNVEYQLRWHVIKNDLFFMNSQCRAASCVFM